MSVPIALRSAVSIMKCLPAKLSAWNIKAGDGRFCVVGAGEAGTAEAGKIEIRPLDVVQDFWGIDFKRVEGYQSVERRAAPRYPCRGSISMQQTESAGRTSAAVADISLSGCYVELMQTFPVGTKVSALLNVESISISFNARSPYRSSRRRHGNAVRRAERERPGGPGTADCEAGGAVADARTSAVRLIGDPVPADAWPLFQKGDL